LFYVVITRAKKRLWVSYANTRYRFGNLVQNEPSRFIEELPEALLDRSYAGGGALRDSTPGGWGRGTAFERLQGSRESNNDDRDKSSFYKRPSATKNNPSPTYINPKASAPKTIAHTPSPDFTPSDTSGLKAGQRVEHQKFGFGEVVKMEGASHNPIATIKFEHNGEKKIMLNYARLRIVES
jgi:DNA helicase-2/ATP-dependent DNA helicase PcrA